MLTTRPPIAGIMAHRWTLHDEHVRAMVPVNANTWVWNARRSLSLSLNDISPERPSRGPHARVRYEAGAGRALLRGLDTMDTSFARNTRVWGARESILAFCDDLRVSGVSRGSTRPVTGGRRRHPGRIHRASSAGAPSAAHRVVDVVREAPRESAAGAIPAAFGSRARAGRVGRN